MPGGIVSPIDYSTNAPSPLDTFTQGVQSGLQSQAAQIQLQEKKLQLQQQQNYMNAAKSVLNNGGNPEDIARLAVAFPGQAAGLKDAMGIKTDADTQARLTQALPIYHAYLSGNTDLAVKLLNDQATSYENAGQMDKAASSRNMANFVKTGDRNTVNFALGSTIAAADPQKYQSNLDTFVGAYGKGQLVAPTTAKASAEAKTAAATAAVAPQEAALKVADMASTIADRNARLGIAKDTLMSDTQAKVAELNARYGPTQMPGATDLINKSAATAATSAQLTDRYNDLASKFDTSGAYAGYAGKAGEALKVAVGGQDAISALKADYNQLRNSGVIKSLAGVGRITDREMATAAKGWPEDNAKPEYVASFLRGVAKLQMVNTAMSNAQAEWATQVGNLGAPKKDITIDGTTIAAGTPFSKFLQAYIPNQIKDIQQQYIDKKVNSAPYMQYANPAGGAPAATAVPNPAPQLSPGAAAGWGGGQ